MTNELSSEELRKQADILFQQKQVAFQAYKRARARTDRAFQELAQAKAEQQQAQQAMNVEYNLAKRENSASEQAWKNFYAVKEELEIQIKTVRLASNEEHQKMMNCFNKISRNKGSVAKQLSSRGYRHQQTRDRLNDAVSALAQKIRDARAEAASVPEADWSEFKRLRAEFESARAKVRDARTAFEAAKTKRERLRNDFLQLEAKYREYEALATPNPEP